MEIWGEGDGGPTVVHPISRPMSFNTINMRSLLKTVTHAVGKFCLRHTEKAGVLTGTVSAVMTGAAQQADINVLTHLLCRRVNLNRSDKSDTSQLAINQPLDSAFQYDHMDYIVCFQNPENT